MSIHVYDQGEGNWRKRGGGGERHVLLPGKSGGKGVLGKHGCLRSVWGVVKAKRLPKEKSVERREDILPK